jgi:hypothetical protein
MPESNFDNGPGALGYQTVPATPVTVTPGPARWIAPTALVLALLAAGAAGWSLLKPAPAPVPAPAPPVETQTAAVFFTGPEVDNPKEAACGAAALVAAGVARQSQINLGEDPAALETVAANTRLAMTGGAIYLRDTVPVNTPPELAEPITALSRQLQDAAQHFFAGQNSSDPEQNSRLTAAGESTKQIAELCK